MGELQKLLDQVFEDDPGDDVEEHNTDPDLMRNAIEDDAASRKADRADKLVAGRQETQQPGTSKTYNYSYKRFEEWCKECDRDSMKVKVEDATDFFIYLYDKIQEAKRKREKCNARIKFRYCESGDSEGHEFPRPGEFRPENSLVPTSGDSVGHEFRTGPPPGTARLRTADP
eukprot:gene20563-27355_t